MASGKKGVKAEQSSSSTSAFQKLFDERAQGFQIDFRFRNAPPRPPVGPIFVGQKLDVVLQEHSQQYKTLNSVEVNHRWELHSENELGVPLAASAMDIHSYKKTQEGTKLHPDDEALLDWKGSMGDTAADELKMRQDHARAAARAALTGRAMPVKQTMNPTTGATAKGKKVFSRVLDESMQTWMKKTTYLSNDHSRKVHDFKSLAKTKEELAQELDQKRAEIAKKRSAAAISQTFETIPIVHPSKKKLKAKKVYPLLPNVENWGKAHTHIIIDKAPAVPQAYTVQDLNKGLIANVEKPDLNPRMTCDVFVSAKDADVEEEGQHRAVQSYDLDIIPLKEDDDPHVHFCFWIDRENGLATYLPLPSRVQLSTGRPLREVVYRRVERRLADPDEEAQEEERKADLGANEASKPASQSNSKAGEDDFGDDDDDDDDEAMFGGGTKTIVAQG